MFLAWHTGTGGTLRPSCWSFGAGKTADGDLLPDVCPDGDGSEPGDSSFQHAWGEHKGCRCKGELTESFKFSLLSVVCFMTISIRRTFLLVVYVHTLFEYVKWNHGLCDFVISCRLLTGTTFCGQRLWKASSTCTDSPRIRSTSSGGGRSYRTSISTHGYVREWETVPLLPWGVSRTCKIVEGRCIQIYMFSILKSMQDSKIM